MAARFYSRGKTNEGHVELLVEYDDITGMTQALQINAIPGGDAGVVTVRMVLPGFNQTRNITYGADGVMTGGPERINIPANRRWNVGMDLVTKDPTADEPEGVSFGLDFDPA